MITEIPRINLLSDRYNFVKEPCYICKGPLEFVGCGNYRCSGCNPEDSKLGSIYWDVKHLKFRFTRRITASLKDVLDLGHFVIVPAEAYEWLEEDYNEYLNNYHSTRS